MAEPIMCAPQLFFLDLSGHHYVVTGGASGIGLVVARQLAAQGARVVLGVRDVAAGQAAVQDVQPRGHIEVLPLDLASLRSVERFAEHMLAAQDALHALVNNAGVMNTPLLRTEDGFELQFGTNHLGHFHLTQLLLPKIRSTPNARIVNLSSCYHDMAMGHPGKIHLDDLNYERRKYNGWEAYAQSKLANLLHAKQLARRLAGSSAVAVSVHPGWVRTRLMRHSMPAFVQDLPATRWVLGRLGLLEPWQGAQASLHALLAPEVLGQSGQYISQVGHYRDKACNKGGFPMVSPNPEANDEELGRQLWMASERLIQTALDRQRQVAG